MDESFITLLHGPSPRKSTVLGLKLPKAVSLLVLLSVLSFPLSQECSAKQPATTPQYLTIIVMDACRPNHSQSIDTPDLRLVDKFGQAQAGSLTISRGVKPSSIHPISLEAAAQAGHVSRSPIQSRASIIILVTLRPVWLHSRFAKRLKTNPLGQAGAHNRTASALSLAFPKVTNGQLWRAEDCRFLSLRERGLGYIRAVMSHPLPQ